MTGVDVSADRFDAVVFDMDGVITDTATVHERSWKAVFDAYLRRRAGEAGTSFAPFEHADYLRYVDGRPRDDGVDGFLRSRGIVLPRGDPRDTFAAETVWGVANDKNHDFLRRVHDDGVRAFPESVALVHALQRCGIGTAVISASRNAAAILDAAGVGDLFPVRVDGIELERLGLHGKPAPDVFLEAAKRLAAPPSRAVVVEDAVAGVEAGRRGGFALVVGVDRDGTNGDALRSHGAGVVVRDLASVRVSA